MYRCCDVWYKISDKSFLCVAGDYEGSCKYGNLLFCGAKNYALLWSQDWFLEWPLHPPGWQRHTVNCTWPVFPTGWIGLSSGTVPCFVTAGYRRLSVCPISRQIPLYGRRFRKFRCVLFSLIFTAATTVVATIAVCCGISGWLKYCHYMAEKSLFW